MRKLYESFAPRIPHWYGLHATRRRAPPRRAATVAARAATNLPEPSLVPSCVTRIAYFTHGQTAALTDPWSAGLAFSGELAATELCYGDFPLPPRAPFVPSWRIPIGRPVITRARVKGLR